MKQTATALEFLNEAQSNPTKGWTEHKAMIEFAKMHIEKIMNLQQSKYYAGETGYITKEEWQDLLNVK